MQEPYSQFSGKGGTPPSNIPTGENRSPQTIPPSPPLRQPRPQPSQTWQQPIQTQPQTLRSNPDAMRPEQKRPYLEHEEVRTMEKDITRIREDEAKKEQQRIAELRAQREAEKERIAVEKIRASALAIKQQEELQKKEELKRIQDSILPPGEEMRIRDLPPPPGAGKKIFVRLLVSVFFAFIALNVALFSAWYFFFRDPTTALSFPNIPAFLSQWFNQPTTQPSPPPPPSTPRQPAPQSQPQPSAISISDAINPVHITTLQFNEGNELSSLLVQVLQDRRPPDFTEIRFQRRSNNKFVGNGAEFFSLFGITLPDTVIPHLTDNSFFFSYSYTRGNRFGMIVETPSPAQAREALDQWAPQMEHTLTPVLSFWAPQKTSAYTTTWRSSAQSGVEIRFQTFSLQDYGMVYAVIDKYIILASSFEATKAAIEALQSTLQTSIPSQTLAAAQNGDAFKPLPSLSFEQALGQTFIIGIQETVVTQELRDTMRRLQPGGVLLLSRNIQSVQQLQQLTRDLQQVSLEYSSLPLFIAVDQEGGAISRIEFGREKTPQFVIQDTEHAYQVGQQRAEELKFLGINLNLSPVLDSTKPNDFLFGRTFQAGRLQAGTFAKALLAGQKEGGILSTVKHFPGYGNISFDPEKKLAALQEFPDISPFVFALPAKPEFLLTAHVIYESLDPAVPFSFSPKGISLIRSDLNFQGIIVTDDLNQPSLLNNYRLEDIAINPLKAGVTMLMFSNESYAREAQEILLREAQQDTSLQKTIEDAADLVLKLKKKFFFGPESLTPLEYFSRK